MPSFMKRIQVVACAYDKGQVVNQNRKNSHAVSKLLAHPEGPHCCANLVYNPSNHQLAFHLCVPQFAERKYRPVSSLSPKRVWF
jgi:hypothetical protein